MQRRLKQLHDQLDRQISVINNEIGKPQSCSTCVNWCAERCLKHKATPPDDFIQANNCEDHDDSDIPF